MSDNVDNFNPKRKGHHPSKPQETRNSARPAVRPSKVPAGHERYAAMIRLGRKELGWTQDDLARKSTYDVKTIQNVENGRTKKPCTLRVLRELLKKELALQQMPNLEQLWKANQSCTATPATLMPRIGAPTALLQKHGGDAPVDFLPPEELFPVSRLRHSAEKLIGREEDLARLDAAWSDPRKNVVVVRAFGGMGKTSLIDTWIRKLADDNWRGADRFFDWSFPREGTGDAADAAAAAFFDRALRAFGDHNPNFGRPWDRGERLVHLVRKSRCLLVLDGLESLQHAPGPTGGKLKDEGIEALLKGLASQNAGLCVVTTRERVDEIKQHYGHSADDFVLTKLTDPAGARLLHFAGVNRAGEKEIAEDDQELQAASREARGHGLTLQLLGNYLRLAEGGDIRRRDTVRLADADHEYQSGGNHPYGQAFKAMEAYEEWFNGEGEVGRRQLAVLRLLGLFDRPASKGCLDALRAAPVIVGLTEPLFQISPQDWKVVLSRLKAIELVAEQDDGSLDAHPLLREYFSSCVRARQPDAWRTAHQRLYEHLCETAPKCTMAGERSTSMKARCLSGDEDAPKPTLEDLQPLYQAIAHGCQAGLQQEAVEEVYRARIQRGTEFYSTYILGAHGADLGAIACFFEARWGKISPALEEPDQAYMLMDAGLTLRALGRLKENEALEPMQGALAQYLKLEREAQTAQIKHKWLAKVAQVANNLSQLELSRGEIDKALRSAAQSVAYADRSGNPRWKVHSRTAYADALHHAGLRTEAKTNFRKAERLQAERQGEHEPSYLYSVQSFRYCDLLLAEAERVAWRLTLQSAREAGPAFLKSCRNVSKRAEQALRWDSCKNHRLGDIALGRLSLGRAKFYAAVLEAGNGIRNHASTLDQAVFHLRNAGSQRHIPAGLLTRAWQRSLIGARTGPTSAKSDLDEAWEIAERGPMWLFLADIHLYRARLFHSVNPYPWTSPQDDLAKARRLIEKNGYLRRMEELKDAEAAAKHWPQTGVSL